MVPAFGVRWTVVPEFPADPLSTTAALTLTRCFRPQFSAASLKAEGLVVARRCDLEDRPTLQEIICGRSTKKLSQN